MNEPSQNSAPAQRQRAVNPQVTEKVIQALLAYRKFMETVSRLEKEEHKLFKDMIKKYEDNKIAALRKQLSEM